MKEADFDTYLAACSADPLWAVAKLQFIPFPYYDLTTRATSLAFAAVAEVSNSAEEHITVVCFRQTDAGPEYGVWCSDKFLESSGLSIDDATARCKEAVLGAGAPSSLATKMMVAHASFEPSTTGCRFWVNWRRSKELCEHATAFLGHLRAVEPNLKAKLSDGYDALLAAAAPTAVQGEMLALEELAFRVPVLFVGDRGAGKTVTARAFARTNEFPKIEMAGHEGLEAIDMLGCLVPAPSGAMVWKDGPLSEAIRKAGKQKVVLIIDELLRVRTRELSVLLTTFSPDEGNYLVRTGRIVDIVDGVAQEETLSCPVSNLCVVATTNVGSEYAVDELDPALAERFVPIRKDTSEAELKRILGIVAKSIGLKATAVTKSLSFFKKMVEANSRGLVARIPTTRTMVRAFELSTDEDGVKRALKTQYLLWVALTSEGQPVPEQVEVVKNLVNTTFK